MTTQGSGPIRALGHPIHTPLTHFPLALWTAAFIGDLVHWKWGGAFWWDFSFWNLVLGSGLGALTVLTGFYDLLFIPEKKTRAEKTAIQHMVVMLTAYCLFGASLYFHRGGLELAASRQLPALILSGLGTACLQVGGWLGGQLVYRHGIGYHDPNSGP
jgi:uncharacterized membrane protein